MFHLSLNDFIFLHLLFQHGRIRNRRLNKSEMSCTFSFWFSAFLQYSLSTFALSFSLSLCPIRFHYEMTSLYMVAEKYRRRFANEQLPSPVIHTPPRFPTALFITGLTDAGNSSVSTQKNRNSLLTNFFDGLNRTYVWNIFIDGIISEKMQFSIPISLVFH